MNLISRTLFNEVYTSKFLLMRAPKGKPLRMRARTARPYDECLPKIVVNVRLN